MTENLWITTLSTSTGQEVYYTDMSVLYWYLGIIIVLLIMILIKRR